MPNAPYIDFYDKKYLQIWCLMHKESND
nr:hypothetical protein [Tanacetum cinerariifolium]